MAKKSIAIQITRKVFEIHMISVPCVLSRAWQKRFPLIKLIIFHSVITIFFIESVHRNFMYFLHFQKKNSQNEVQKNPSRSDNNAKHFMQCLLYHYAKP